MNIPMELLIDYMGYLNPEIRLEKRDLWVKGIKLSPENGRLEGDYLYFSQIAGRAPAAGGPPYVLVCPHGVKPSDNARNCVILHTDVPVTHVFNELLGLQSLLQEWGQKVELSISRNGDVQQLLDLSGKVFGNPILITTPSFKVVASTTAFETDDPMFHELLENGCLSQETFDALRDGGYLEPEHFSGETFVIPPNALSRYSSTITAVCNEKNVNFLILMLCSNTSASRGILQLFNYFIEKLNYYLLPAAANDSYMRNQYDYFITDLLEGRITTPREIAERSLVRRPAYTTDFCSVLVSLENPSDMFLERAQLSLDALFPNVRCLRYQDKLLLHPEMTGDLAKKKRFFGELNGFLEVTGAYGGVSELSRGIDTVRRSYIQASEALKLGLELLPVLSGEIPPPECSRIFRFRDFHLYSMLTGGYQGLEFLEDILRYDLDHGTDYCHILQVFLETERSFTKSGEILGMHRNNVIYHIKRMSEIFSLDLDDSNQRLRILMLFRLEEIRRSDIGK